MSDDAINDIRESQQRQEKLLGELAAEQRQWVADAQAKHVEWLQSQRGLARRISVIFLTVFVAGVIVGFAFCLAMKFLVPAKAAAGGGYPPYEYWVAGKSSQRVDFECAVTNHVPCTVSLIYHAYAAGTASGPYGLGTFDSHGEDVVEGIQLQDGPINMNHTDRARRRVVFGGGLRGKEPTTYGDQPGRGFYLNVAVVAHWSFTYHG